MRELSLIRILSLVLLLLPAGGVGEVRAEQGGVVIGNDKENQFAPGPDPFDRADVLVCFDSPETAAEVLCPRAARRGRTIDRGYCRSVPRDRSARLSWWQRGNAPELQAGHLDRIVSIEAIEPARARRAPYGASPVLLPAQSGESLESYVLRAAARSGLTVPALQQRIERGWLYFRHATVIENGRRLRLLGSPVWNADGEDPMPRPGHPSLEGFEGIARCGVMTTLMREVDGIFASTRRSVGLYADSRLLGHPAFALEDRAALWLEEILMSYVPGFNENSSDAALDHVRALVLEILKPADVYDAAAVECIFDDLRDHEG